ncbi:MAG: pyridoxamine 5'-phosphate oxidase family protein [Bacillota bacterium]|jgi:nitroimidazol reductase NimA-like FMN-containing flavoprotein (pyridoxamine 5'-phosphate oxidase superfamily)
MTRKMQKSSRQLPDQEAKQLLAQGDTGVLSINGDDGYPYGVPMTYIYVEKDQAIYLHSANYGYKWEALQENNKVCFTAILSSKILPHKSTAAFESVIVTGIAHQLQDDSDKRAVMDLFVKCFCKGHEEVGNKLIKGVYDKTGVIRLEIEELKGKAYRDS